MTLNTNIYGAVDIQFDYVPNDSVNVLLATNILAIEPFNYDIMDYYALSVRIATKVVGGVTYYTCSTEINDVEVDNSSTPVATNYTYQKEHVRVYIHDADISVYVNGKWIYSFVLAYVNYTTDLVEVSLSIHGGSMTLENIKRTELHDYRDAVYVDYEATTDSAIQSVIQERPVQVFSEPATNLSFTYNCVKDVITAHHVQSYQKGISNNNNISSDGLIYYTNVSINTSQQTADEVGLITRMYRLSNLETGAVRATKILQRLALERRYPISMQMRFDPRIVIADELVIDYYMTGTGTHIQDRCIVEDVQVNWKNGAYAMNISGRTLKNDE